MDTGPTALDRATPPPSHAQQQGSVLVWALFFVTLTTGILIAHSIEMSANRRQMDTRYRRIDQANTIAESGLTDATAYLRRQTVQPVTMFDPQLDLTLDPPVNDTIDPTVGLVREFEVHGNLWGRYEVRKSEARDVSADYAEAPGTVWDIGARGFLYERNSTQKPFDQAPNRVLSTRTVYTEVRGVQLNLPASSALVLDDPSKVQMLGNATVDGSGGPAIAYKQPSLPAVMPVLDATITGSPISLSILGLDLKQVTLFGMREDRLKALADVTVVSARQLAGRVIKDEVVYVPDDLVIDPADLSLRGRMLLLVGGSLFANPNNNSDFRGVVYVKNDITIEGPFTFAGTMVAGGVVKFGGGADLVAIKSSPTDVTQLQDSLSQYRISKSLRPGGSTGAYATTTDLSTVK